MPYPVFLSAVSTEFESTCDAVTDGLRAKGADVLVHRSLPQDNTSAATLERLHDCICDSHLVICLMGNQSGSFPPPSTKFSPQEFLPANMKRASYAQWEYHFACYYEKRIHIYLARPSWKPDRLPSRDNDPVQQQAFIQYVKQKNRQRVYFQSTDQLRTKVCKQIFPRLARQRPNNLPYPSLGKLFKGRAKFLGKMQSRLQSSPSVYEADNSESILKTKPIVISGPAGVGKTRAAVEYAWQHGQRYSTLLFVIASSVAVLDSSLANLTSVLNIEEMQGQTDAARAKAVLDWLAGTDAAGSAS